jgi:methylase of polypeptide subunit release factors
MFFCESYQMPRIHPRTVLQARTIDQLLPRLLPACKDIRSSHLELRWLREHVAQKRLPVTVSDHLLESYVLRRSRGEPLQYILGSEYFGELEIKCQPGVLIPRFVLYLSLLSSSFFI